MRILPLLPHGRLDGVLFRSRVGIAERKLELDPIAAELRRDGAVVFPSHFFDHPQREEILELARRTGGEFAIQLSPGAELLEFFEELKGLGPLTLELVMDRCPHRADFAKLATLEELGFGIRPVFCPVPEIDAAEAIRELPESWRSRLLLYFAPGLLEYDEIFLVLTELAETGIAIRPYPASAEPEFPETGLQREFRQTLNPEIYRAHFGKMGKHSRFRSAVASIRGFRFSSFPLAVLIFALTLIAEPVRAYGITRSFLIRAYHRFQGLTRKLFALLWASYLLHPAWFLKTYIPPIYWVVVFPLQKAWWFTRYQLETRIFPNVRIPR